MILILISGVQITESHEGPSIEKDRLYIEPDVYTRTYFKPGVPHETKVSRVFKLFKISSLRTFSYILIHIKVFVVE